MTSHTNNDTNPNNMTKRMIGDIGENTALNYLSEKGMKLIERNYTVRGGELDLIMRDGECVVFVEVKTRRKNSMGMPLEYITAVKRERIMRTAREYINANGLYDTAVRFDAVEVIYEIQKGVIVIVNVNHIENAFWEGY